MIVCGGQGCRCQRVRAGSTLTMAQALRNLMAFTGGGAETVSRLMTANPARLMGWAGKGELDVGKDADLVLQLDGGLPGGPHCGGRAHRSIQDKRGITEGGIAMPLVPLRPVHGPP